MHLNHLIVFILWGLKLKTLFKTPFSYTNVLRMRFRIKWQWNYSSFLFYSLHSAKHSIIFRRPESEYAKRSMSVTEQLLHSPWWTELLFLVPIPKTIYVFDPITLDKMYSLEASIGVQDSPLPTKCHNHGATSWILALVPPSPIRAN